MRARTPWIQPCLQLAMGRRLSEPLRYRSSSDSQRKGPCAATPKWSDSVQCILYMLLSTSICSVRCSTHCSGRHHSFACQVVSSKGSVPPLLLHLLSAAVMYSSVIPALCMGTHGYLAHVRQKGSMYRGSVGARLFQRHLLRAGRLLTACPAWQRGPGGRRRWSDRCWPPCRGCA